MQINLTRAASAIEKTIKAKKVPMLHGSPAIGKSAIIRAIAKKYNLCLIDKRLAQCDPTDLQGFPSIKGDRSTYLPPDDIPLEGDAIPVNPATGEPYAGWLLFLDEINSAPHAVQAAAYKLLLDRMVGQRKVHPRCAMAGAGNLETDGAIVNEMSTALQSRLIHFEVVSDFKEWLKWAYENKIDHRITSYIEFKPTVLYQFKADHTDFTYASNRTWEFANDLLAVADIDDPDCLPMLAGAVSEGVAREFLTYCKIYKELPKMDDIIAHPDRVEVPNEPSYLYALTGAIGDYANPENLDALMQFVNRLPEEFQVITLRGLCRRDVSNSKQPAVQKWIATHAEVFF